MRILAVETSTDTCSVAIGEAGRWCERVAAPGVVHSEVILELIDELFRETHLRPRDLGAVAFGAGPGSFTGLRIACGIAQGLAWGVGVGVVPVDSLLAMAVGTGRDRVVVALDARMNEVYCAAYERQPQGWLCARSPVVGPADAMVAPAGGGWFGAGGAFALYPGLCDRMRCESGVDASAVPMARDVAALALEAVLQGRVLPPEQAAPVYVRDRVARTIAERVAGARP